VNDPWLQLGLTREADDDTVRAAWLAALRRHPPERSPERFEALRAAYERIDTHRHRLAYRLFEDPPPDAEELVALALLHARGRRSASGSVAEAGDTGKGGEAGDAGGAPIVAAGRPSQAELRRLLGESAR